MKDHIETGAIVLSDNHMSYVNLSGAVSNLGKFGFYHMWTNHSIHFIHEKFPYNHTLNIERSWSGLKRRCYMIGHTMNYDRIQEHCDVYMMKARIIRKRSLYDFTMRSLHDWYRDK